MAGLIAGDVLEILIVGTRVPCSSEVGLRELLESVRVELVLEMFELGQSVDIQVREQGLLTVRANCRTVVSILPLWRSSRGAAATRPAPTALARMVLTFMMTGVKLAIYLNTIDAEQRLCEKSDLG